MTMDGDIFLVSQTYEKNDIGVLTPVEETRQVLCTLKSVTQSEFYKAGQSGFNPQHVFVINPVEYHDESVLIYNDTRYSIYRTYRKSDDELEIYAEYKAGV